MDWKYEILKKTPQMLVEEAALNALEPDWIYNGNALARPDNKFFRIVGRKMSSEKGLEVTRWKQPMIEEKGGEVTLATYNGSFLIRPKQEPGNPKEFNYALWAAGFQASEANKSQAHEGTAPAYSNIEDTGEILVKTALSKDGNRFLNKANILSVLKLDQEPQLLGGARLIPENDLALMITLGLANEHLVETYALFKAAEALGIA